MRDASVFAGQWRPCRLGAWIDTQKRFRARAIARHADGPLGRDVSGPNKACRSLEVSKALTNARTLCTTSRSEPVHKKKDTARHGRAPLSRPLNLARSYVATRGPGGLRWDASRRMWGFAEERFEAVSCRRQVVGRRYLQKCPVKRPCQFSFVVRLARGTASFAWARKQRSEPGAFLADPVRVR